MKPDPRMVSGSKERTVDRILNLAFRHIVGGDEAAGEKARKLDRRLTRRADLRVVGSREQPPSEPDRS